MFGLGSLLINIISNDISNAQQKNASVKMIVVSYIPLAITTVVVWCLVNHFFIEVAFHSQPDADRQDTGHILVGIHDTGSLDPQVIERLDLHNIERSCPQADQGVGHVFPRDERTLDPQDNQGVDPQSIGRIPGTPQDLHEQDVGGRRDEQHAGSPDGAVAGSRDYPRTRLLVDFFIGGKKLVRFRDRTSCLTFPSSRTEFQSYYMALTTSTGQAEPMLKDLAKALHAKHPLVDADAAFPTEAALLLSKALPSERNLQRCKAFQRRRSKP